LHILDRHSRDIAARGAQPLFRLNAEPFGLRGSAWFLGHHIVLLKKGSLKAEKAG
jgi:hypothetical protein